MSIWSSAAGAGTLTVRYDFSTSVSVFESFCTENRSSCLFSAIDPGFMAPATDTPPIDLFRIADGTVLRIHLVAADAGVSLNINGIKLSQVGESALLGTMPSIHVHASWQVVVPGDRAGTELSLSFRVSADGAYDESDVVQARVLPLAASEETPTPTPTVAACAGDCDGDGAVSMGEVMTGVHLALEEEDLDACAVCDANQDEQVTIEELGAVVNAATNECPTMPPVSFAEIQQRIFTPKCATLLCHDSLGRNGALVLTEAQAYDELVGVEPSILSARDAGLLRVAAGEPERSFLLIKLDGPPPAQGSRMPLGGLPLSEEETDLIRRWILEGASR